MVRLFMASSPANGLLIPGSLMVDKRPELVMGLAKKLCLGSVDVGELYPPRSLAPQLGPGG